MVLELFPALQFFILVPSQVERLRREASLYSESNRTLREERDRTRAQVAALRQEADAAAAAKEALQQRVK